MSDDALKLALQVAVPLRIAELSGMTPYQRSGALVVWREHGEDAVAYAGDYLQVRHSHARGETAKAFNRLACGLAALAHAPGGVSFADLHWCPVHPWGVLAEEWDGHTTEQKYERCRKFAAEHQ
jgi:hypothetical protein